MRSERAQAARLPPTSHSGVSRTGSGAAASGGFVERREDDEDPGHGAGLVGVVALETASADRSCEAVEDRLEGRKPFVRSKLGHRQQQQ